VIASSSRQWGNLVFATASRERTECSMIDLSTSKFSSSFLLRLRPCTLYSNPKEFSCDHEVICWLTHYTSLIVPTTNSCNPAVPFAVRLFPVERINALLGDCVAFALPQVLVKCLLTVYLLAKFDCPTHLLLTKQLNNPIPSLRRSLATTLFTQLLVERQ